ncbi:MAG: tRNA pseudouridine(38-40) synthase TruA [Clostridia bacterium]|nr:tRNA pseudouridine(38-40) synthase TruA [Clostridia bacterium]
MRNFLFKIKYDGSAFHGWQIQPNGFTVQQAVKDAVGRIFNQDVTVNGCSRTDAGVHANEFCFNCRIETEMTCERIINALNAVLPDEAVIFHCEETDTDFHARFDCKGKEYVYLIDNSPYGNPFLKNRAYHYKYPLDEKLLDREAKAFIGKHDFAAFCASGSSVEDTVREVFSFDVVRNGDMVEFRVSGDGFLYNMVRIMVGTLIDISRGKIPENNLERIIASKSRKEAGVTAPSEGLYLNKVFYEDI